MIIKSFYNLGVAYLSPEKDEIEILLDLQRDVKSRKEGENAKILVIEVDMSGDRYNFEVYIEDYSEDIKYQYLLGRTSGNKLNYSLTWNIEWSLNTDDIGKSKLKINFNKTELMKNKIESKGLIRKLREILKRDDIEWVLSLIDYIINNSPEIIERIKQYFIRHEIQKFNYPAIIKIKKGENAVRYLGDFEEFIELYKLLYFIDEVNFEEKDGQCIICNKQGEIINGFNLGFFTIDQEGFNSLFIKSTKKGQSSKLSYQYLMCRECYLKTMVGFNIAEKNLRFYAFSMKSGGDTIGIYHYIVPINFDLKQLRESVEKIKGAFRDHKLSINEKLQIQKNVLSRLDRKANKKQIEKLKTQIKNLEKQLKSNTFDIVKFIQEIINKKRGVVNVIDLYFKEDDSKQNPSTKTIISELFLTSEKINRIYSLLYDASEHFNFNKDISKVNFLSLKKNLMGLREFMHYFSSFYNLTKTSRKTFNQIISSPLKSIFIKELVHEKKEEATSFLNVTRAVKIYDYLMEHGDLWI
ncbi:MAG: hypothetical protein ACTSRZ_04670 [Promethearchaeota archaeon]